MTLVKWKSHNPRLKDVVMWTNRQENGIFYLRKRNNFILILLSISRDLNESDVELLISQPHVIRNATHTSGDRVARCKCFPNHFIKQTTFHFIQVRKFF